MSKLSELPPAIGSRSLILALAVAAFVPAFFGSAPSASASPIATASDYDCADFVTQAEAEEYLEPGDPYNLDADSDGIACEDLPCPCSYESGGDGGSHHPPPPPEPPKLNMAAAKRAAWNKAHSFDRRNPRVSTVHLNRCVRRSKYHVNCRFVAGGRTGDLITTCNLGVAVSGKGSAASARLDPICRSYRELTAARALAAMRIDAEQIAGRPVEILEFGRHSRLTFTGQALWNRADPAAEECTVSLVAELLPSDEVIVRVRGEIACVPG